MSFTRLDVYLVRLTFTLNKLKCSKQASCLNSFAWNNGKRPRSYLLRGFARVMIFYWFDTDQEVMINRSSRGH